MELATIFWIAYLSLSCFSDARGIVTPDEIDLAKSFAKYITNYVTIITNLPKNHNSSMANSVTSEIMENFPAIVLSIEAVIKKVQNKKKEPLIHFLALNDMFERQVLKIILLDSKHIHTTRKLMIIVKFLKEFARKRRASKCAIILINSNNNVDFQQFFKYSWKHKFLYITIIEVLEQQRYENHFFSHNNYSRLIVHQYNPFNNSYYSEPFSRTTELFPDKLSDFYGQILNTGMNDQAFSSAVKHNFSRNNILDATSGIDVEIAKTLAKTLNFSINMRVIISDKKYFKFPNENVTHFDISSGLKNGTLDFWLTLVRWVGCIRNDVHCSTNLGILLYPNVISLLTKQYGTYRIHMPVHVFLGAFITSFITIACIIISISKLKFDMKVWTLPNIMAILIGNAITSEPQKVSERIFFLCLMCIYILFSVNFIDILMDLYLYQKSYLELTSLDNVIDAGTVIYLTNETKRKLCQQSSSILRRFCQNANPYEYIGQNCVDTLLADKSRSVKGCDIRDVAGMEIQKIVAGDKERLISLVKEPLLEGWDTMMHATRSPYVEKFDDILRRLFESGLIILWTQENVRDYLLSSDKDWRSNSAGQNLETHDATPQIIFILTIGYLFSFLILISEIAWSRLKIKTIIQHARNFKFSSISMTNLRASLRINLPKIEKSIRKKKIEN